MRAGLCTGSFLVGSIGMEGAPSPTKHYNESQICHYERCRIKRCSPGKTLKCKQTNYEFNSRECIGQAFLGVGMVIRFAESRSKRHGVCDGDNNDRPKWVTRETPHWDSHKCHQKEYPVAFSNELPRRCS